MSKKKSQSIIATATWPDAGTWQAALTQDFPDGRWLLALELALPTGVLSTQQLQRAHNLSRDQISRLAAKFQNLAGDAILTRVSETLPRPGQRGQPPLVYKLGEAGAALLRAHGHPEAHACNLTEATPIAHALATLDVRLAALQAGLTVQTETPLPYDDTVLRPDNLVTLPDGTVALFETEQSATLTLLRRIRESVQHKLAFFRSPAARGISSTVRVLFNLPRGKSWDQAVGVWERATALVANPNGGDLPFKIVALPLGEFLAQPDWGEPPDARWESLFDPAQTRAFAPAMPGAAEPAASKEKAPGAGSTALAPVKPPPPSLPLSLKRHTPREDRLIIQAYLQHILEQGPALAYTADHPCADPEFFTLVGIIYTASHPPDATPWQQAQHPFQSLYLLRQYLTLHPRLKGALQKAIEGRSSHMTWNPTTILHRMQVAIDTFLKYHGLHNAGGLRAWPISNWNRDDESADFRVLVSLHPEMLIGERGDVVPLRDEVRAAEEALAWVLYALFAYSEEVNLGLRQQYPPFW